jgi:hypothetical protein
MSILPWHCGRGSARSIRSFHDNRGNGTRQSRGGRRPPGPHHRPEDYATPRDFALLVLRQEIDRLRARRPDLPAVECVEPMEFLGGRRQLRPIQFQLFRRKAGDDGGRRPSGAFRIGFATAARGSVCLGHSSHFGMGLFLPETA